MDINDFLREKTQLLIKGKKFALSLEVNFWQNFPKGAGVYILKDLRDNILYVGETKTLNHRLKDLLHTHNHSFRRAIFVKYFSNDKNNYKDSKELISKYICQEIKYSYLEVSIGRKELEEYIIKNEKGKGNLLNYIRVNERLQK